MSGFTGTHEALAHAKDDDFFRAGELYRLMSPAERQHLVEVIAGDPSRAPGTTWSS